MADRNIDIESKLLALLELSKSTAPGTEHEAKLALEMAIRLAAKHSISLSELANKRRSYAGDWFAGSVETETVEYTDERYRTITVRGWCDLIETFGWQRHRRSEDEREGLIWMYRQPDRAPKLEVRIFERPWGDIEYEVVRNPDPILGRLSEFTNMGFDCVELGVTYTDFKHWLEMDRRRPFV